MSAMESSRFEGFVGNLLGNGDSTWPDAWRGEAEKTFLALAADHGVEALLYDKLYDGTAWEDWPPTVRDALKTKTQSAAVSEVLDRSEITEVLSHLRSRGLRPLLFKGTPLAYSHYTAPHLRPRRDNDLLLPRSDKPLLLDALAELGYQPELSIPGDVVQPQTLLVRTDEKGMTYAFHVHWKISNAPAFAYRVSYDELEASATPVPQLGPAAIAPNAMFALLIACLHRTAHHYNCKRLIWLYDIHLIVQRLQPDEFADFSRLAFDKEIAAVCLDGLEVTRGLYGTAISDEALAAFRDGLAARPPESTRVYLSSTQSRGLRLWRDLRAAAGPVAALRLLRQHLLPPPSYMLERYRTNRRSLLPVLYTRRLVQGIPKFFRRIG